MVSPIVPGIRNLDNTALKSFPFTIQETTGPSRQIVLRGRSLPFQGVEYPSEMRVNKKYFPGNPQAQAQVLGATWGNTVMGGRWSDWNLNADDSNAKLFNFPPQTLHASIGGSGGDTFEATGAKAFSEARTVRALVDAMYMVQRSGQLLKVSWGHISRYGFIEKFSPKYRRTDWAEWEIEFTWVGDTNAPEIFQETERDYLGLLQQAIRALQEFLNQMNEQLANALGEVLRATQLIKRIGALVTDFVDIVNGFAGLSMVPAQLIGTVLQQVASIKNAIADLVLTLRSVPAGYLLLKKGATQEEVNKHEGITAAILLNAQKLGLDVDEIGRRLKGLSTDSLAGLVTTTSTQTLRDVAREHLGSADAWTKIADYNGFSTSVVPGGTVVRIPKR